MNIILRSILIGFLVAIPSPFLLDWLAGMNEANSGASTFAGIYLLAFVGCIIMGLTHSGATKVRKSAAVSGTAPSPAPQMEGREEGTVKWFNVTKGFGFITRDSGEDVFVHYRSVRGNGRRTLREGQRVMFVVVDGDKGLQADDVSVDD
ncbi:MAG: cold-shock protein [Pseudomonadales bacterium]